MDSARRARVDEEREIRVAVNIDEAGGDDLAGRVDLARRLADLADNDDPVAPKAHVGPKRLTPRAVDHQAVSDRDVDAHGPPRTAVVASRSTRPSTITTP